MRGNIESAAGREHRQQGARQQGRRPRENQRRGVTAVEFAIVAPVILLLFLGAIEITRLNFLRHTAANAAYEGARRAIIPGGTARDADAAALHLLSVVHANQGAEVDVDQSPERVSVTVVIPVNLNSWGVTRFTSGYNIVQSCTLSREIPR